MFNIYSKIFYNKKYIFKEIFLAYRFIMVGLIATITHIFFVLWLFINSPLNVYVANICAFFIAFLVSFLGHYFWTFNGKAKFISALYKMLVVSFSAFFLNMIMLTFFIKFFLFHQETAALAAALIVPLLSFFGMRLWIFSKN